jgi:hypothetical protein
LGNALGGAGFSGRFLLPFGKHRLGVLGIGCHVEWNPSLFERCRALGAGGFCGGG